MCIHTGKEDLFAISEGIYMHQNNIAVADVMKNSGINRNYGYNIINGTRKSPEEIR